MNFKNRNRKIVLLMSLSAALLSLNGCVPIIIASTGAAVVTANVAGGSVDTKTSFSDKGIKIKAVSLITGFPGLTYGNSDVEVVVFNKILLLLGQVPTENLKENLAARMSKIPGVKIVYNQLVVGKPHGIGNYVGDSWTTSKVISALITSKINSLKYKVITENKIVYLMGVVTDQEGEAAAMVAAKVSGVKKVIKIFSYISNVR